MNRQHRVLIIDSSEENREVLKTVLERHGMATMSAGRIENGVALARANQPDLIVLDIESVEDANQHFVTPLAQSSQSEAPLLLILGCFRRQGGQLSAGEFVSKPYQYGNLIRKIEELIGESEKCRHCSSSAGPTKAPASN